jgi:hypothetical protein
VPYHHKHIRRNLLLLSWANWAIAVVAWSISAYLGIASPARIFVYTILFLVGIFAVVVAIACFLLERFGHEPLFEEPQAAESGASVQTVAGSQA